ncbi:MAG: hypothetical protein GY772_27105 [bacterium]|nr:hypothetical protein [bacterium]
MCGPHHRALVIRWEGANSPIGVGRAARALDSVVDDWARETGMEPYHLWWCRPTDAADLATALSQYASAVFLDADGREVTQ